VSGPSERSSGRGEIETLYKLNLWMDHPEPAETAFNQALLVAKIN
jgi:hypothetical protein